MADITQYSRWVSSIATVDNIIHAIDESKGFPEIYDSCSKTADVLMVQRTELTEKTREFEIQYGIELKLDDPELKNVTHVPHGHYIIFDVPIEEFARIMGFKFSGWSTALPSELEPYLENRKDLFGEVEVTGYDGKTVVALVSKNAVIAVIKRYLERK